MEVVPVSVGRAAQAWDEQHLDLAAAAGQVGSAGSSGFTTAVAGTASRFLTTWQRHVERVATTCEDRADGLRRTMQTYVDAEGTTTADIDALRPYLVEER
ncbi:hypothetical protein [Nocardioides litoris]|uniref:hypothetical protein n=1 Tax=Nocardioides litoris TaxID=1926648 RepID=UPI00111D7FCE|nr:hypothetical protein [Nocardioides litoris]